MSSQICAERLSTFTELFEMLTKDVSKPIGDHFVDFLTGYLCKGEHPFLINTTIKLLTLCTITLRQVEQFDLEDLVEEFGTDPQAKIDFVMKVSRMEVDEHIKEHPLQKKETSSEFLETSFIPIATSTPKRPVEERRSGAVGVRRRLF